MCTLPGSRFSVRVVGSVLGSVLAVLSSTFADAQFAPPGPVPTSAPGVSAEAQTHIEAARAAAGTMWEGVFQPVCNGRDSGGLLPEGTTDPGFLEVDAIELF